MLDIKFCSKLADSVTQLAGRGDAIYREFQTNVDSGQSSQSQSPTHLRTNWGALASVFTLGVDFWKHLHITYFSILSSNICQNFAVRLCRISRLSWAQGASEATLEYSTNNVYTGINDWLIAPIAMICYSQNHKTTTKNYRPRDNGTLRRV